MPNGKWTWHWSFVSGVSYVLLMNVVKEVFDDPTANGIPFLLTWHQLAADMSGLITFIVCYIVWFRLQQAKLQA
ncbi:hypothetical protein ACFS3C_09050 [Azotobacter vinelandii]|uniref:hypothetical protein n=1 Tax=Azotobacter TaxID=352 RepID=UPI0005A2D111|nr:hypothetical protein [Azotobacter vinelandii]WKN23777.1 hypothetical protein AVAEIV_001890 [Azotobacter vinelandii]GLK61963.1 hypothetical protein GCM10017624_41270 [Azotobacter vinelandii]